MRHRKDEMPITLEAPGMKLRSVGGQGGMAISHYVTTEPADMGPVLKSLRNGSCSVPHWGYVIKGKITLEYENGVVEAFEQGDVYYQPPGHNGAQIEAGTEVVEFSPDTEFDGLIAEFKKAMGG